VSGASSRRTGCDALCDDCKNHGSVEWIAAVALRSDSGYVLVVFKFGVVSSLVGISSHVKFGWALIVSLFLNHQMRPYDIKSGESPWVVAGSWEICGVAWLVAS